MNYTKRYRWISGPVMMDPLTALRLSGVRHAAGWEQPAGDPLSLTLH